MKKMGVKREVAERVYRNNVAKKRNKEKEDYKNMSAAEKEKVIKRKYNH
jgi:hypothetical protein